VTQNTGIVTDELLISWGSYLYWAELRQREWHGLMTGDDASAVKIPTFLGVSCYWAASLYVVIEGWDTAGFKDPIVDALLGLSNYKDTLRRLRNGTFHYQPGIISPKVTDFFQSPDVSLWLHFLHHEFCRWLRDSMETAQRVAGFSPELAQLWQKAFVDLIGWLPNRPGETELKALRRNFDETEAELNASGDTSQEAQDLRASLRLYDEAVEKTAETVRQYRRDQLAQLGLNPDHYIP
jgi:hypothetical protein